MGKENAVALAAEDKFLTYYRFIYLFLIYIYTYMGNYQDKPRTDTHVVEHGSIEHGIMISEGHLHGRRITQEDTAFVNIKNIEELPGCSILGLFDGHGGPNVALYAARNFERVFREQLSLKVVSMVGKNPGVRRDNASPAPSETSASVEARKMFDTAKNEYNINKDVEDLYKATLDSDKQETFDHFNKKNEGFVKVKDDVEYYHIRQYLYGIVDQKQDDMDCIEAFEKMLEWKYENIHDSVINIEENVIIEPEFIKTLFEDAFKAIDEEIKIKFFEWSDDHECYKLYENYYGRQDVESEAAASARAREHDGDEEGDPPPARADDPAVATWIDTDAPDHEDGVSYKWLQGRTAEVMLFTPKHVITAHAGDSRTIHVNNNGEVKNSGEDHKPHKESEVNRIEGAGGKVIKGRVQGMLACSRGLGDFPLKSGTVFPGMRKDTRDYTPENQMVSCIPDVDILDKANIQFLATACDGVWDVIDNEQLALMIKKKLYELKKNDAFPTYLNKMSETVKYICIEAVKKLSLDNISLLLTFFDENDESRYEGSKNILTWDPDKVIAWVNSFDESSASHVGSGVDDDAVKRAITMIKTAFKGKNINGEMLLSPELIEIIGLQGEQTRLAKKILDDELEIIKIGPKGWNLDWFEAWLEVSARDSGEPLYRVTRGKLLYINFIKHMCETGAWSCNSVEPYDKIGEIILGANVLEIKKQARDFAMDMLTTIPAYINKNKDMVESIRNIAREKARETIKAIPEGDQSIVAKLTDEDLLRWVVKEDWKKQLVLYNEMVETFETVKEEIRVESEQVVGYNAKFVRRLQMLQKGQYDWLKIKKKFYELKKGAQLREEFDGFYTWMKQRDASPADVIAAARVREAVARADAAGAAAAAQFEAHRRLQSETAAELERAGKRARLQAEHEELKAKAGIGPGAKLLAKLQERRAAPPPQAPAPALALERATRQNRTVGSYALGAQAISEAALKRAQRGSGRGGKKSRKLRKRTIGGKKSRKRFRKRRTIKGGKRKRRRTRRRR